MCPFFKQCQVMLVTIGLDCLAFELWNHSSSGLCWYAILPFHINWIFSFSLSTKEIVGLEIGLSGQNPWCPIRRTEIGIFRNHRKQNVETRVCYPRTFIERWETEKRILRSSQARWLTHLHIRKDIISQKMYNERTKNRSYPLTPWAHRGSCAHIHIQNVCTPIYHIQHTTIIFFA